MLFNIILSMPAKRMNRETLFMPYAPLGVQRTDDGDDVHVHKNLEGEIFLICHKTLYSLLTSRT